jgi:hypothetical protein
MTISRSGIGENGSSTRWPQGRPGIWQLGRGGIGKRGRIYRLKTHTLTFTDHTDRPALMVFQNHKLCPLPPLYSYAIYFTYAGASAATVDTTALFDIISATTAYRVGFRIELYFLPEGTQEDCIAHYHGEKAARNDCAKQLVVGDALSDAWEDMPEDDSEDENTVEARVEAGLARTELPGLVPKYDRSYREMYRGCLYMIEEGSSWPVPSQKVQIVEFDAISQAEYDTWYGEDEEPETLQPCHVLEASLEEAATDMTTQAYHPTQETDGAWQKATAYNWKTW